MPDYSHAVISGHCLDQLAERKLSIDELALVYLWRVVIDISCDPPKVVTVYRTSKLKKYLKEH